MADVGRLGRNLRISNPTDLDLEFERKRRWLRTAFRVRTSRIQLIVVLPHVPKINSRLVMIHALADRYGVDQSLLRMPYSFYFCRVSWMRFENASRLWAIHCIRSKIFGYMDASDNGDFADPELLDDSNRDT